jgi:hypothetical protein
MPRIHHGTCTHASDKFVLLGDVAGHPGIIPQLPNAPPFRVLARGAGGSHNRLLTLPAWAPPSLPSTWAAPPSLSHAQASSPINTLPSPSSPIIHDMPLQHAPSTLHAPTHIHNLCASLTHWHGLRAQGPSARHACPTNSCA